jgi:murein DD-endopeptidase MepM/ murein hydrolase activator NlpD
VASNIAGDHWRFRITHSWVKAMLGMGFVFTLLVSAVAVDYVGLLPKASEHETLVAENKYLMERGAWMKNSLETKLAQVQQYKVVAGKLRRITGEENIHSVGGPVVRATASVQISGSGALLELAEKAHLESQTSEQEMLNLLDSLAERQSFLIATPTIKPVMGYYSSPFGFRIDPINRRPLLHAGVDIAAPYGTQVFAPADGIVSFAGYENGYGNVVSIDHGYGVITRYGHNSKLFVRGGQRVHRWDVISAVGSTGHSTGSHLHYEVISHGIPVDPMNYILQEK